MTDLRIRALVYMLIALVGAATFIGVCALLILHAPWVMVALLIVLIFVSVWALFYDILRNLDHV